VFRGKERVHSRLRGYSSDSACGSRPPAADPGRPAHDSVPVYEECQQVHGQTAVALGRAQPDTLYFTIGHPTRSTGCAWFSSAHWSCGSTRKDTSCSSSHTSQTVDMCCVEQWAKF
jgi:hypothetical protein